jgi:hypothetical protein
MICLNLAQSALCQFLLGLKLGTISAQPHTTYLFIYSRGQPKPANFIVAERLVVVLPRFRLEAGSEPKLVTSYDRSWLQFSSAMTGCLPNGLSVGEP